MHDRPEASEHTQIKDSYRLTVILQPLLNRPNLRRE